MSILEVSLFLVGLLLFFTYPSQMAYVFLHTPHLGRGFLGFMINRMLPKSHDLVEEVGKALQGGENEEAAINFETFRQRATNQMRTMFINLMSNLDQNLKLYFALTVTTSFLDFIDFIIQLIRFGGLGDVTNLSL